jgi:hypothetical protein
MSRHMSGTTAFPYWKQYKLLSTNRLHLKSKQSAVFHLQYVRNGIQNDGDNFGLLDCQHITQRFDDTTLNAVSHLLNGAARRQICDDPYGFLLTLEVTLVKTKQENHERDDTMTK